jgi:low affinity Fe/Cu permease
MQPATRFVRFATGASRVAGRPMTFVAAGLVVLAWMLVGPVFHFSDTWQLAINTGTTIITFLMVFLIQNTQNRDTEAIQIKLDELIRAVRGAHNALLDAEHLTEEDLQRLRTQYEALAERARAGQRRGQQDTGVPRVNLD